MNTAWLLQQHFSTALIFRESSGASTARPVLIMEVLPDNKLLILEQGMMNATVKTVTLDELAQRAWPDLQGTYYDAAVRFDMAMRLWLPYTPEARDLMNKALLRGREMVAKSLRKPPAKTTATKKATPPAPTGPVKFPGVYADYSRRTCIAFENVNGRVALVPMPEGEPFELEDWNEEMFARRFNVHLADYPLDRAAGLYASYAAEMGASKEALEKLGLFVNISEKEIQMATAKKAAAPAAKKPAAKAAAKAVPAAKKGTAPVEKKDAKPKGESAASMFQALLLEGKHTDDAIFAKVQAKFGLDDKKRSYVGWYRNYLRKAGQTVADPIQGK